MASRSTLEAPALSDLFVQGRGCRLFEDDTTAAYVSSKEALMPWQGDKDAMMDRYDVRHMLDSIVSVRRRKVLPSVADTDEAELQRERFMDLDKQASEDLDKSLATDGAMDSQRGGAAIPFNYSNTTSAVGSIAEEGLQQPDNGKTESARSTYRPPFLYPLELESHLPPSEKLHQIMAHTAKFIVAHGGQAEIVLRVKQAKNPNFSFLTPGDQLYPYFRYLVTNPDYMSRRREASPPAAGTPGTGTAQPPAPNAMVLLGAYGDEEEDDEEKGKQREEPPPEAAAPLDGDIVPAAEAASDPAAPSVEETLPAPDTGPDASPTVETPPAAENVPATKAEASPAPEPLPEAAPEADPGPRAPPGAPPSAKAEAEPKSELQSAGLPSEQREPVPTPAKAEPEPAPAESLAEAAAAAAAPPPPLRIVEPPLQMQLIIEKMVEFIARNGASFEGVVRERDRAEKRFLFLLPENEFHGYYKMRLQGALQPLESPTSAQEKEADVAKPSKGMFIRSATLTGAFARAKASPAAQPVVQPKEAGQPEAPAKEAVSAPQPEAPAKEAVSAPQPAPPEPPALEKEQEEAGDGKVVVGAPAAVEAPEPAAPPAGQSVQEEEGKVAKADAEESAEPEAAVVVEAAQPKEEAARASETRAARDEELERAERRRRRKQRKEEEALRLKVHLEREARRSRHREAGEEVPGGAGRGAPPLEAGVVDRDIRAVASAEDAPDMEEGEARYPLKGLEEGVGKEAEERDEEGEREERRRRRRRDREERRREHERGLAAGGVEFAADREEGAARRQRRTHRQRDQELEDGGPLREFMAAGGGGEDVDKQAAAAAADAAEEELRRQRRRERKRQRRELAGRYEEGGAVASSEEEDPGDRLRRRPRRRTMGGGRDEYGGDVYADPGERDLDFPEKHARRKRSWPGYDEYEAEEEYRRRDFRAGFQEYAPADGYRPVGYDNYGMRGNRMGYEDEYGVGLEYRAENEERERVRRREERRRRRAEDAYDDVEAGELREDEDARVVVPPEIRARVQAIYRM